MSTQIPQFITGKLNIKDDTAWNDYCKMIKKYGPGKITTAYQRICDQFK